MKKIVFLLFLLTLASCGGSNNTTSGTGFANDRVTSPTTGYNVDKPVMHEYCTQEPSAESDYVCGIAPCNGYYNRGYYCKEGQSESIVLFANECSIQYTTYQETSMDNCRK